MRVICFFDCLPFSRAAIPTATVSPAASQKSTGKTAFYGPCKIRDAGRRPNRPPGGFSGLRPLARLRRAACGLLPLCKPSPHPNKIPAPDGPKPSACRLISLLASRRNQGPLCVKEGGAKRRRDRFGTGCNYFKMTGRSQLLLPKGALGGLLESAMTDFFNTQKPPAIGPGVYSHCGCPVERGREEGLSPSSGKWRRRKRR